MRKGVHVAIWRNVTPDSSHAKSDMERNATGGSDFANHCVKAMAAGPAEWPGERTVAETSLPLGAQLQNPQRPDARHSFESEGMVRSAWRHAESGRNDLTADRMVGSNKNVGPYPMQPQEI